MAVESVNYQNSEATHPRSGLFPGQGRDSPLASNLLIACSRDLEAVMTRSISARTACCVLTAFFLAALAGCGGSGSARPDGPVVTGGSAGAGGSIVADGGGSSGGTAGTGSGGASTTGGCSGAPVTFQVMPAPNSVTHWCLGQPAGGCSGWFDLRNSVGSLELGGYCRVSCGTCTFEECPPIYCLGPTELTDQGVTQSWDGTYVTSSTCGASATTCDLTTCAVGQYTINVCGFPNPDPSSPDGCYQAPSTTNSSCVSVPFEYPAIAPIVVTMPVE